MSFKFRIGFAEMFSPPGLSRPISRATGSYGNLLGPHPPFAGECQQMLVECPHNLTSFRVRWIILSVIVASCFMHVVRFCHGTWHVWLQSSLTQREAKPGNRTRLASDSWRKSCSLRRGGDVGIPGEGDTSPNWSSLAGAWLSPRN